MAQLMINGKRAEQIKRNLSWLVRCDNCSQNHEYGCDYENRTKECQATDDAMDYINYLENRIEKQNALLAVMGITIPEE